MPSALWNYRFQLRLLPPGLEATVVVDDVNGTTILSAELMYMIPLLFGDHVGEEPTTEFVEGVEPVEGAT